MTTKVTLYYADWCHHCNKFKPEWDLLKQTFEKYGVEHAEFEDKQNPTEIKAAEIEGFPTIMITRDDHTYRYNGLGSAAEILNHLNILPQRGGKRKSNEDPYKAKYIKYKTKYLGAKAWVDSLNN